MTYFPSLQAPDLTDLGGGPLLARLIFGVLLQGKEPPSDVATSRLLTGYVTVTDKALREYSAGRQTLTAYLHSNNQLLVLADGLGRMETSINSAKRALRLLGRIAKSGSSLAVDRTLRKLAESSERALTPIRNAIEHIDYDITFAGGLEQGEAHLLAIDRSGTYLEIAKHRLSFEAFAKALRTLHAAAASMVDALPQAKSSS